ncbi:hypothetical protein MNBD_NITROSPINAE03-441 [hydrothermal vent metagenome]|uniref:SPOR domain-containing protein n=1 Tax=hydrothermal vent metagenome TaxID=652676 RepID=A0A3B1C7V0_9ZZZZ
MDDQQEYNEAGDNLLEDFELEMREEERIRKKKRNLVIGGIVAGAILWFFLSSGGPDVTENQQTAKSASVESKETKPDDIDTQIAKLNEQNRIDEDFKAPGALMENTPMEPAVTETKPEPQPQEEITPVKQEAEAEVKTEESGAEDKTVAKDTTASTQPEVEPEPVPEPEDAQDAKTGEAPEKIATAIAPEKPEKSNPYTVQVSATMDSQTALKLRDLLLKKGFDSWIFMGKSKQRIYKVESEEFKSIQKASALSAALAQAGFANRTSYVKNGSRVTLITGMFADKKWAERLNKRILSAGFRSKITTSPDVQTLYIVRVGKFKAVEGARTAKEALGRAGFAALGITQ